MQIRAVDIRTRFWTLKSSLIIEIESIFACRGLIVPWMEEVLNKIGAHFCTIEVFNVGITVNDLYLALGEGVSTPVELGVIITAI